jgi:hypothetical protein
MVRPAEFAGRARACATLLALAAAASPARAEAPIPGEQAPPASAVVPSRPLAQAIELDAGATCLEHERLVGRVGRWLERDQVDARIGVRVLGSGREDNAVAFAITLDGQHRAERKISEAPRDCDQLHSALALSIALAIDATLLDAQRGAPVEVPSDDELLSMEPPPPYFRLALAAVAQATSGLLTDIAPAGSARIELGFVPWLDLRAGVLAAQVGDQRLPGVDGRFEVALIAGRFDACGSYELGQLRLLACVGGVVGSFRTRGRDFSLKSFTQHELFLAFVGGPELQAEITPWLSLAVAVDLAVPLQRREINVLGPDTRPAEVGARELTAVGVLVGAGPVFRFF